MVFFLSLVKLGEVGHCDFQLIFNPKTLFMYWGYVKVDGFVQDQGVGAYSKLMKTSSHSSAMGLCMFQLTKSKLVNARYCDKFPHVRWRDGTVVHVQVTPEIHRNYEARIKLTLEAMQQR